MSARDDVLTAVRNALGRADRAELAVPRGYRAAAPAGRNLVDLFAERVTQYRAELVRCSAVELQSTVLAALGSASRVLVPTGFPVDVPGGVPDADELDSFEAVVTTATIGIATTGTIVLDHGPGQGRRALSLVPDLHVCVVRQDQIVAGVPAAVAAVNPGRPQTWISGPSATSDIELNRVEGVHGPRRLTVVLVAPDADA